MKTYNLKINESDLMCYCAASGTILATLVSFLIGKCMFAYGSFNQETVIISTFLSFVLTMIFSTGTNCLVVFILIKQMEMTKKKKQKIYA